MSPRDVVRALADAFRGLTVAQRRRLAAHARDKTPVHVGPEAVYQWVSSTGAG